MYGGMISQYPHSSSFKYGGGSANCMCHTLPDRAEDP